MRNAAIIGFVLLAPLVAMAQDNWPSFRGGAKAGVAEGPSLPDSWNPTKNVAWSVEIPGRGWSSPIAWGNRVFVTSVTSEEKAFESRKGLYIQDLQGKTPPGEHRWLVHCLDLATGKMLWQREAFRGKPASTIHIKNSFASETPVTDGQRVYAYFGNVGLVCFDLEGQKLWERTWPVYRTRMGWGMAASPVVHEGRVFLVNDNEEKSFLTALDAKTGKTLWEVSRDEKSNWATPFLWQTKERTELVTAGTGKVRSYNLDGQQLWELTGMSSIAIPTPFAAHDLLYIASGYIVDPIQRPIYAIRPGASGDLTLPSGETSSKSIAWYQRYAGPYHPTPLVYGDYLYVLYDRGMLSCYDAKTGKPVYERQRLGGGSQAFTASPWAYNGKLFCLSEDGETFVIKAGPKFELLGKNNLDDMSLSTPALASGNLLIRTQSRLYCLRQASIGENKP